MLKGEREYKRAKEELKKQQEFIANEKERLQQSGADEESIEIALQALLSFSDKNFKESIEEYENIKNGNFPRQFDFTSIGYTLVCYRIFLDISQTELANRLGISPSQVSRDETNLYYGSSVEKIGKVMEALGLRSSLQVYEEGKNPTHEFYLVTNDNYELAYYAHRENADKEVENQANLLEQMKDKPNVDKRPYRVITIKTED